MEGVAKVFPVAKLDPPVVAANHVTVAPVGKADEDKFTVPGPHLKLPIPTPKVGTSLTVATTAVLAVLKQPLLLASA